MIDFVLGIDPGATGALALWHCQEGRILKIWDMPYETKRLTTGKNSNRVVVSDLVLIFNEVVEFLDEDNEDMLHIHIEKVQAFGKQSAPAAFNFGYAANAPYALAIALQFWKYPYIDITLVAPNTWKKQHGLIVTEKDEARLLVLRTFPDLKDILKRKQDVDRADAILIALYRP